MTNHPNGTSVPSGDRASERFFSRFLQNSPGEFPLCSGLHLHADFQEAGKPHSLSPARVSGGENDQACGKAAVKYIKKQTNKRCSTHKSGFFFRKKTTLLKRSICPLKKSLFLFIFLNKKNNLFLPIVYNTVLCFYLSIIYFLSII